MDDGIPPALPPQIKLEVDREGHGDAKDFKDANPINKDQTKRTSHSSRPDPSLELPPITDSIPPPQPITKRNDNHNHNRLNHNHLPLPAPAVPPAPPSSSSASVQPLGSRPPHPPLAPPLRTPVMRQRQRVQRRVALQLEADGVDHESLRQNGISTLHHQSEMCYPVRYVIEQGDNHKNGHKPNKELDDLDPVLFHQELHRRNVSSTNCVDDTDIPKPLPCDAMYLSRQRLLEIGIGLIRKRNFQNVSKYQWEILNTKQRYRSAMRSGNFPRPDLIAQYQAEEHHLTKQLHGSILRPIDDADIMEVIMEQGVKPMLAALHRSNMNVTDSYNLNVDKMEKIKKMEMKTEEKVDQKNISKKSTNSTSSNSMKVEMDENESGSEDEDIPINQLLEKSQSPLDINKKMEEIRKRRRKNVSAKMKRKLARAPHGMILENEQDGDADDELDEEEEGSNKLGVMDVLNLMRCAPVETERALQLSAMLDMNAPEESSSEFSDNPTHNNNDGVEDEECWLDYLIAMPFGEDHTMAAIPHSHCCGSIGIENCLISETGPVIPSRYDIQRSNVEWRKQFDAEAESVEAARRQAELQDVQLTQLQRAQSNTQSVSDNIPLRPQTHHQNISQQMPLGNHRVNPQGTDPRFSQYADPKYSKYLPPKYAKYPPPKYAKYPPGALPPGHHPAGKGPRTPTTVAHQRAMAASPSRPSAYAGHQQLHPMNYNPNRHPSPQHPRYQSPRRAVPSSMTSSPSRRRQTVSGKHPRSGGKGRGKRVRTGKGAGKGMGRNGAVGHKPSHSSTSQYTSARLTTGPLKGPPGRYGRVGGRPAAPVADPTTRQRSAQAYERLRAQHTTTRGSPSEQQRIAASQQSRLASGRNASPNRSQALTSTAGMYPSNPMNQRMSRSQQQNYQRLMRNNANAQFSQQSASRSPRNATQMQRAMPPQMMAQPPLSAGTGYGHSTRSAYTAQQNALNQPQVRPASAGSTRPTGQYPMPQNYHSMRSGRQQYKKQ